MNVSNIITYFIVGGVVTTVIVQLEASGYRLLSGLAALIPVFTLVSYFFIGKIGGGLAVSQHAKFVLIGTLVSWVPYMIAVIVFAPRIGSHKAIIAGLAVFFASALVYLAAVNHHGFFK